MGHLAKERSALCALMKEHTGVRRHRQRLDMRAIGASEAVKGCALIARAQSCEPIPVSMAMPDKPATTEPGTAPRTGGLPSASSTSDDLRERLEASLGAGFTIERELGGGGMSRVYVAHDARLGRDVVVKVLEPDLAEQLSTERFGREVRLAASLQEPHIIPVLAAGQTADGLPYYTMPFVRGESLRARLTRVGALPLREGVAILRDVAKALAFAHAEGVVHRDIKPENILLSSGTAVVTDFGIAKAIAAARNPVRPPRQEASGAGEALTQLGTAVGTPAYSAPEQAVGDPDVDHRADLYSWGVVAYEVLAGEHPFAGRTTYHALIAAHLTEQPHGLADRAPQIPAPVAAIIMRCLEKEPARRPQDAGQMVAALEGQDWTLSPVRRRIVERTFEITDDVCRRLDRPTLDARLFGRALEYMENDGDSRVLLCCLHGLGHDAADYTAVLETTPHRAIAPTLFGFERAADRGRVPIAIESHIGLVRELLRSEIARIAPKRVVLIGFSSGADVALRLLATANADTPKVDACLAIGPNLSLATCFASRVFSKLHGGNDATLLSDLQRFGAGAVNLDEWLNVMAYVLDALRKFRDDVAPLSRFATDILRPFEANDAVFAEWFRRASDRVALIRCVFEESDTCAALVQDLRLRNLDDGVLGPRYRPESLVLQPPADHFALVEPARIERHIESIVAALG